MEFVNHPLNVLLVFMRVESACAVDEQSAWHETLPSITHYLALQHRTFLHIRGTPLANGRRVFAEHSFA